MLALLGLILLPPSAQEFEVTQEKLDALLEQALPVVVAELGYGPSKSFRGARPVSPTDMERCVLLEDEVLAAVVVHELVHAADHAQVDLRQGPGEVLRAARPGGGPRSARGSRRM